MPFQKITAKFKKTTRTNDIDPSKMEITPYRDWRILVTMFFIGLIVSIGFNVYMSTEISRDSFFTVTPKAFDGVKLNDEGLAKIIADIDEKAARFEAVKNEGVQVVDPSL